MNRILAVDPGIQGCGCAVFKDGTLQYANYVKNIGGDVLCCSMARSVDIWLWSFTCDLSEMDEIIMEYPKVYTQGHLKGDPNDLLPLAGVDAAIAMLSQCRSDASDRPKITFYLPQEWKRQVPKAIHHERIIAEMTELEKNVAPKQLPKSILHNVYDAIGIGLFHLQRLNPKRVIAR